MKKTIILAMLMVLAATSVLHAQSPSEHTSAETTTFILVRHAEKMSNSEDPELTDEGVLRVKKLDEMVSMADISAIYSTDYRRTKATVQFISEKSEVPVTIYEPAPETEETEHWIEMHKGKTVLISGHSNTIPTLANKLLGRTHFENNFDESDYGNLLVITVNENDRSLLHLRY